MTAATMVSGESAVVAESGANAGAAMTGENGVTVASAASAVNAAAGRAVLADLRNRSLT